MSQRSFPPSFWNSSYQPSVSSTLGSALSAPHTELPFPGDPYSSVSLHSHLHQSSPDAWHPSHHHHHHHHHPYSLGGAISTQGSAYPRPGVHEMYGTAFDPRYGSLLVPSVRPHHRLTSSSSVPGPSASPCDLGGKGESGTGSAWSGAFTGAGAEIGLNMDTGIVSFSHRVKSSNQRASRSRKRFSVLLSCVNQTLQSKEIFLIDALWGYSHDFLSWLSFSNLK